MLKEALGETKRPHESAESNLLARGRPLVGNFREAKVTKWHAYLIEGTAAADASLKNKYPEPRKTTK